MVGFSHHSANLRKIRAHRIKREEAEEALLNDPIAGRLLAIIVTAYDLDAGQKRDYLQRRLHGE